MEARWAPHLTKVMSPPILQFKNELKATLPPNLEILDLTQAIPAYGPPLIISHTLEKEAHNKNIYFYTDDQGLVELRTEISKYLPQRGKIKTDQILVTAGANMAFLMVMLALLEPGDEVILPTPFYFNHEMAVRLCHGEPVEVLCNPDAHFSPNYEQIRAAINQRTKAIVVVSPNNPTGALYPAAELDALYDLCQRKGIFLIHDETYEHFDSPSQKHYSLLSRPDWTSNLISIHSFSKTFSLTGFRVGYLVCRTDLLEQLMKVQDTMVICAPHLGQRAVLAALTEIGTWLEEKRQYMRRKLELVQTLFRSLRGKFDLRATGAFFAYVQHSTSKSSYEVARLLGQKAGIIVLPGTFFGTGQDQFLRCAFGNISEKQLRLLVERLITIKL